MPSDSASLAIAQFMRRLSRAALDLADQLERPAPHGRRLEEVGLGSLQLAVAQVLATAQSDTGASPRELARALERGDEPNVRTALNKLRDRGVAELVPDLPTQRWRLTSQYRQVANDG